MNNWTVMAPHAQLKLEGPRDLYENLDLLPGVKHKRGLWLVPLNAVSVVHQMTLAY